jgi:hypothetical protein
MEPEWLSRIILFGMVIEITTYSEEWAENCVVNYLNSSLSACLC